MIDREHAVLLIVDIQLDFLPGGKLAVSNGDAIIGSVETLMLSDKFPVIVATQDWHPPGHVSFASSHAGKQPFESIDLYGHEQVLWPDHCVVGTAGAELHPGLPWQKLDAIIRKGTDPKVDSYSAFCNNWNANNKRPPTGLSGYLEARDLTDIYIAGLARDYCVKWTAEDAARLGFRTSVLWDLTRPVDPSSDARVRQDLAGQRVSVIDSFTLD